MKKLIIIVLALSLVLFTVEKVHASSRVGGYSRRNGSYVAPHYRSTPNYSKWDNWSTKGNYNPYTGKKGYVNPYKFGR